MVQPCMFSFSNAERGFSLFELIMVIVVMGIVAAVAAPFMTTGFQSYVVGRDIAETDGQARLALERMSRDLRNIRSPADLTIASSGDITFMDIDGNSTRYCLGAVGGCPGATGELTRNSQPLAAGISALSFTFLTKSVAGTSVASQVYYVTVAFTATQGTITKSYQTTVNPRNFP